MKTLKTLSLILLCLFLSTGGVLSEEESKTNPAGYDLTGTWTLLLSNSITRKQITFLIKQEEDGRPRGHMRGHDFEEQRLDGRIEEDNKVKFWGTYRDPAGGTLEYEFAGVIEGEPGTEKLVGTTQFFGKRYEFTGRRAKAKKKR